MERNQKVEDYMRTIYRLQENGLVRGAYVARELGVSKPTVSVALGHGRPAGGRLRQPRRPADPYRAGSSVAR